MITLLISLLISSPGTLLKDGGLPPMLLNPDTVVKTRLKIADAEQRFGRKEIIH